MRVRGKEDHTKMDIFKTLTSNAVPLNRNNIDTDQIIPARFLKGTQKTGLGEKLFHDWRYLPDGKPNPDFPLNRPQYVGARILVAADNFGCGSSREHAPWALKDYGFQAIIAISFADIFKNNAAKNHLLPVALPEDTVMTLLSRIEEKEPNLRITIDLQHQTVHIPNLGEFAFEIDSYRKECLLKGLDDIGYTLSRLPEIEAYERKIQADPYAVSR